LGYELGAAARLWGLTIGIGGGGGGVLVVARKSRDEGAVKSQLSLTSDVQPYKDEVLC